MAQILVASALSRVVEAPSEAVAGQTLRAALDDYFDRHPAVRGYVLDEQGALRRHVAIFVDGTPTSDRSELGDAIGPSSEIHIIQALSGG